MMRMKFLGWTVLLLGLAPTAALAQQSGLDAACAAVINGAQSTCRVVAQAVESAQPQLGALIAGGNPTPGTASTGGLRLGVLPRVSVGVKVNAVQVRIPDLSQMHPGPADGATTFDEQSLVVPALSGSATVGIFPGLSIAPTIGGIGAIDLIGSATWLPFRSVGSDDFQPSSADFAYGAGVRVGVLRESFTMPGASVSLMYHNLGNVGYGSVCPGAVITNTKSGDGYTLEEGTCNPAALGDVGEFSADLTDWSGRAAVSKHFLGLGLAAGVGYDRFSSDLMTGLRGTPIQLANEPTTYYVARIRDVELQQDRFSAFVDGSLSLLIVNLAAEVGWMQGADATAGYPSDLSDFDPGKGTFFGSVGLRISL